MATLFFYGTLMDAEVRRHLMGRDVPVEAACIKGFRAVPVAGKHYPVLVPNGGCKVEGVLARNIDRQQLARLIAYEGPGYCLETQSVIAAGGVPIQARVFMPRAGVPADMKRDWDFKCWQKRWKRKLLNLLPVA